MADPTVREKVENARAQLQDLTFDRVTGEIEEVDHDTPNNPVTSQIDEVETPRPQPQQPPNDHETNEIEEVETPRAQPQQPPNDRETNELQEEETPRAQRQQPPNDSVAAETEDIETSRAQPQHPPNDPVADEIEAIETSRAQPQQPPNDPVAAENNSQPIDPKLLRAIVNGDLILFKSILGTNVPTDVESTRVTNNGGNGVVRGVTCAENNALHVVAGVVIEKTSQTSLHQKIFFIISFLFVYLFGIGLILISLMGCYIMINRVIRFVRGHFPWIPQKIYEKAIRTQLLMWVFPWIPYMEIADIIYRQDPTLLYARNCAGETPLHCAANAGNLHMVSLLVKFARTEGQQKLEQLLRARNKVGETGLHGAARSGYSGIVKELLCADEMVAFLEDDNGISPLYLAVTSGCLDVVQQLIAAENPPSYAGPEKPNALHAAVIRQKENIMRVILEWNLSLAAKTDKAKNTPLHYAALIGNTYAVRKLLLKDTESAYKVNSSGSFPVHLAAEAGNVKVIKELLRMCPDVGEQLDKEKKNFLHIAVERKWMGVILFACLEGNNANVINAKDKDGNTPLHLAVISSDSETFSLLSQNNRVNPNIRNEAGLTPLEMSASLPDHQFTHSLNPQSFIHRALLTRGAFQNPSPQCLSKIGGNLVNSRENCPNRREGKEMRNGVEVDIEKESTNYENMSKSLTTGAVLIASASFIAIFTVTGVYKDERTTLGFGYFFSFVAADASAFILSIISTIGLLYCALSNIHLRYRKYYFQRCTPLLYGALGFFILTYGLGVYITIAPLSQWLADLILSVSCMAWGLSLHWNPSFIPKIYFFKHELGVRPPNIEDFPTSWISNSRPRT